MHWELTLLCHCKIIVDVRTHTRTHTHSLNTIVSQTLRGSTNDIQQLSLKYHEQLSNISVQILRLPKSEQLKYLLSGTDRSPNQLLGEWFGKINMIYKKHRWISYVYSDLDITWILPVRIQHTAQVRSLMSYNTTSVEILDICVVNVRVNVHYLIFLCIM